MQLIKGLLLIFMAGVGMYMGLNYWNSFHHIQVKIPTRDFFKNVDRSDFQISKDGAYIAFMKSWRHRMNVYVMNSSTKEEKQLTKSLKRKIGRAHV